MFAPNTVGALAWAIAPKPAAKEKSPDALAPFRKAMAPRPASSEMALARLEQTGHTPEDARASLGAYVALLDDAAGL